MGMFRIADNPELETAIKQMATDEERSEAKVREMLLREAVVARGVALHEASAASAPMLVPPGFEVIPGKDMKIAPKKNARLAQPKNKRVPKGIEAVVSCPHGYAIGNCKKQDCNRKYRP
jgi:hypothetical protein